MGQTPVKVNCNTCYYSTPTTNLSSTSLATHVSKQRDLQSIIKHELRSATFEGDWVQRVFCPVESPVLLKVMKSLAQRKPPIFSQTPGTSLYKLHQWPDADANEKAFYLPFVNILNAIIDTFKEFYPARYAKSAFAGTRFRVYDKAIRGSIAGEAGLKPDLMCDKAESTTISWYQAFLAGEVKHVWSEMIAQAGTYARCLFAASEHRIFVPIICLNQVEGSFRLCLFHRGGLLATTPMLLNTADGFRSFVSTILGVWHWDTREKAGYEPSMTHSHISFNNSQYRINAVLCRRQAIRARATSVCIVGLDDSLTKRAARSKAFQPILIQNMNKKLQVCSRLSPFDDLDPALPPKTKHLSIDLPETFIVKCSHQPDGRDKEEEIFSLVQGFVGIPDILAGYEALQFEIPTDYTPKEWDVIAADVGSVGAASISGSDEDTTSHEDNDSDEGSEASDVKNKHGADDNSDDDSDDEGTVDAAQNRGVSVGSRFEIRHHRHIIIKTMGRRLDISDGPKKLARALQHAIIGHCALFTVGHYLHRDVSNGNIIILPEALTKRKIPPLLTSVVQSSECIAVLIDGDVAKRWGEIELSSHRPGTLPFLSRRLIKSWNLGYPFYHTPIDDLESFSWLLLYELLRWSPSRTRPEELMWRQLNIDIPEALSSKGDIFLEWVHDFEEIKLSRTIKPFRKLLHRLFASVATYERQIKKAEGDLTSVFDNAYREFVQIFEEEITLLPDEYPQAKKGKAGSKKRPKE
ncbi:hypothetical protein AB1N83_008338 [Pleurotus pulmonarius]